MAKQQIVIGDEAYMVNMKWVICDRCNGDGSIGNPAFDGISMSDPDYDEEFFEDYFSGHYDVACPECHGEGKMLVVDEDNNSEEFLKAWEEEERYKAEREAERMAEQRFCSGRRYY